MDYLKSFTILNRHDREMKSARVLGHISPYWHLEVGYPTAHYTFNPNVAVQVASLKCITGEPVPIYGIHLG